MKNFKLGLLGMVLLGTSLASFAPESASAVEARSIIGNEQRAQTTEATDIAPKDILVEKEEVVLDAGDSLDLKATVSPENATNKQLIWDTIDEGIVTVDAKGRITGVNPGSTAIEVSTANGEITTYIDVTVNEVAPKEIKVAQENVVLEIGKSSTLQASVLPVNTTDQELFWISMDDTIVDVDDNGKLTAKKAGTTEILILSVTNFGEIEKYVTVTVKEKLQPANLALPARKGVYFSKEDINQTLEVTTPNKATHILFHLTKLNTMYDLKLGELDFNGGTGIYNVQTIALNNLVSQSIYNVNVTRKLDSSKIVIMYVDKKNPKIVKDYFIVKKI